MSERTEEKTGKRKPANSNQALVDRLTELQNAGIHINIVTGRSYTVGKILKIYKGRYKVFVEVQSRANPERSSIHPVDISTLNFCRPSGVPNLSP